MVKPASDRNSDGAAPRPGAAARKADMTARLQVLPTPPLEPDPDFPRMTIDELLEKIASGRMEVFGAELVPEVAKGVLDLNRRNRPKIPSKIKSYADDLIYHRWRWRNGQTISINVDGDLDNGQHRLLACIAANVPLRTLICVGNDRDAFETIDQHAKRSVANILSIDKEVNTRTLGAVVRLVWLYDQDMMMSSISVPPTVPREVLRNHPTLADSVNKALGIPGLQKIMQPSVLGFSHYQFHISDTEKATTFFDLLKSGANMAEDHPVLRLRNLMINRTTSRGNVISGILCAYSIKAWNIFKAGGTCNGLSFRTGGDNPERFPTVQ